ncbi:DUF5666 domain-containing protein [Pseudoalteromonas sp. XMcav1-K]|uniref:DUF5666 domain-containing protein n=1 Tax=Pseudoalteromonas sp. XMcav1-K TaxID=3374372 RepID=UPI0037562E2D
MTRKLTLSLLAASTLSLVGCGGSSTSHEPAPIVPNSGELNIGFLGLPDGASADVLVEGPNGYSNTVSTSTLLTQLAPGTYTLSSVAQSINNKRYLGINESISLNVSNGLVSNAIYEFGYATQTIGTVSGFGSLYVNGVRYNTDNADFTINGQPGSEDAIRLGDRVVLSGLTNNQGRFIANSVNYEATATGHIQHIDYANETITVHGQTFVLTGESNLEEVTFDALKQGDFVEISAVYSEQSGFLISKLERKDDEDTLSLTAKVTALDSVNNTLTINDTTFDTSNVTVPPELAVGDIVEIEFNQLNDVNVITDIEIGHYDEQDGVSVILDGPIVNVTDSSITIANTQVLINDDTDFEDISLAQLANGTRVVVEAIIIDNQHIAEEIALYVSADSDIEGVITDIDLALNNITVNEREYTITPFTLFDDESGADDKQLALSSLGIGDFVEIDFYNDDNGNAFVTKLEREEQPENDDDISISGKVSNINLDTNTFNVSGITVFVNASSDLENRFGNDVPVQDFMASLSGNDKLELEVFKTSEDGYLVLEAKYQDSYDDSFDIEGSVTEFNSIQDFNVNGFQIITDENTQFSHPLDMFQNGVEVEIDAVQQDGNTLLALAVELEGENDTREIEGEITAIQNDTITVNDTAILLTADTQFENGTREQLREGVTVEIDAFINGQGQLVATEIEFEQQDDIELNGSITEIVSDFQFKVNDTLVYFDANTQFENGNQSKLALDVLVEVDAIETAIGLYAAEIEFKANEEFEIEGEIQNLTDTQFTLSDVVINYSSDTQFELEGNQLENGLSVEVAGTIDKKGQYIAWRIAFDD